jgi:hypothetical protein
MDTLTNCKIKIKALISPCHSLGSKDFIRGDDSNDVDGIANGR